MVMVVFSNMGQFYYHHKNASFRCRCILDIVVVNNITTIKYELLWFSFNLLDKNGISSGNAECTLMERGGKIRQDFMDLSACTRERLAHVRDCKTGHWSLCYFFCNVTKSCLRDFNF